MMSEPRVVSTTTKLSDEMERRLTASAGYDSLVHCQVVVPVAGVNAMHQAALGENAEHFLHVVAAVLLRSGERQLERRALHVVDEDVQVVRIDQRMLRRRVEEVRGVTDHELIERRTAGDEDGRGSAAAGGPRAPRAATSPRSFPDTRP